MSDLNEFRIYLFEHGKLEEFILFVMNFKMTLADTGTLVNDAKGPYLHTLVCGEVLRQF